MQIECPSCAAMYEVPDQLVKRGPRALRCAACGRTWSLSAEPGTGEPRLDPVPRDFSALVTAVATPPAAAGDAAPADAAPAEEPAAAKDGAEAAPAPGDAKAEAEKEAEPDAPAAAVIAAQAALSVRPSVGLLIAWLATLGGLGTLILLFAFYPQGVVARWPAAARLYEAVGISVGAS